MRTQWSKPFTGEASKTGAQPARRACIWLLNTPFENPPEQGSAADVIQAAKALAVGDIPDSMGLALVQWVMEWGHRHATLPNDAYIGIGQAMQSNPRWFTQEDMSWITMAAVLS